MNRIVFSAAIGLSVPLHLAAQTVQIVSDLPGSFIDITGTGEPLMLTDDAVAVRTTTIGNPVYPPGTVVIGNNGGVGFRKLPTNNLPPLNEPIPSSSAFGGGQAMLAFWDDLDDKCGDVYFEQCGDRLIVQWDERPLSSDPQQTVTFQLQVLDNPNTTGLMAQLIFTDIEQPAAGGGVSATIGYQDGGAGYGDSQWSFNTSGAVANGTVLSFVVRDPIPTVSEWGLIIMMLLLTTAGTILFRRRRYRVSA